VATAMPKRRLAALTVGGLAVGTLSAFGLGIAPAHADESGTITIDKSFDYACDLFIQSDPASPTMDPVNAPGTKFTVGVRAQSTIPGTIYAGQSIAPTPTTITLHLDDNLWNATALFTGGWDPVASSSNFAKMSRRLDGSSSDSSIGFTVAGQRTNVLIDDLSVKNAAIPGVKTGSNMLPESPWLIPTAGTVREIPVPAAASGQTATLQMPATFTANAILFDGQNIDGTALQDYPTLLDCDLPNGADNALLANPIPIVAPATTALTVPAVSTAFGKSARLSYAVTGVGTGSVQVREGAKVLATGSFADGKGSVALPALAVGSHALTVTYAGRYGALASTTASRVTVVKAASSIGSVSVAPKKIKAKKTAAKLVVGVSSAVGAPTGTVTVKLKGKKVGSAALKGGKATVKLKKFAKKGKQTLTVTYGGSATVVGATKTVKVTVK